MKQTIKINENHLKQIVAESVKRIMNEYYNGDSDGAMEYTPSTYDKKYFLSKRGMKPEELSQLRGTEEKTKSLQDKNLNYNGWNTKGTHGKPKFFSFLEKLDNGIYPIIDDIDEFIWHIKGEDRMSEKPYYNYTNEELEAVEWVKDTLLNIRNTFLDKVGLSDDSRYKEYHY
jgi:hypothetical protein